MVAKTSYGRAKEVEDDVESLLRTLHLSKDSKDRSNLPEVKWLATVKLLTSKQFSEQSLFSTMRKAWNTARDVSFLTIGRNLFLV